MPRPRSRRGDEAREHALAWLDRRVNFERLPPPGAAELGLARMRRLLAAVGGPHRGLPVVHVAGTKGKGSTVAALAAILEEAGHRVGRYLSPHVHAIEERIAIDGRPIAAGDLAAALEAVIPVVERLDAVAARRGGRGPTWFEVLTAAAFVHFARARVDVAVLETGLGGRLDATNVVRPLVSVITSISLDHMAVLGPTIARIAAEKAGIIKRGRPVVSGAMHPSARRVIAATAARRRATLLQLGRDFTATPLPAPPGAGPLAGAGLELRTGPAAAPVRYRLAMPGGHQAENAALAVMAARRLARQGIAVPEAAIVRGLARARLPARIEVVGRRPLVVVDAAHNVASMKTLVETLWPAVASHRPRVLLFAASGDKQIEEMLALAAGMFDRVVVTRYATNPRAASIDRLVAACRQAGLPRPSVATAPPQALALARSLAGADGLVCVAGSFFLAAEIGRG
ncbi:MAG: bifunctional folylpolyglutamate synthase/dihydrofolate synthase [Planctomycetia bacterium]